MSELIASQTADTTSLIDAYRFYRDLDERRMFDGWQHGFDYYDVEHEVNAIEELARTGMQCDKYTTKLYSPESLIAASTISHEITGAIDSTKERIRRAFLRPFVLGSTAVVAADVVWTDHYLSAGAFIAVTIASLRKRDRQRLKAVNTFNIRLSDIQVALSEGVYTVYDGSAHTQFEIDDSLSKDTIIPEIDGDAEVTIGELLETYGQAPQKYDFEPGGDHPKPVLSINRTLINEALQSRLLTEEEMLRLHSILLQYLESFDDYEDKCREYDRELRRLEALAEYAKQDDGIRDALAAEQIAKYLYEKEFEEQQILPVLATLHIARKRQALRGFHERLIDVTNGYLELGWSEDMQNIAREFFNNVFKRIINLPSSAIDERRNNRIISDIKGVLMQHCRTPDELMVFITSFEDKYGEYLG